MSYSRLGSLGSEPLRSDESGIPMDSCTAPGGGLQLATLPRERRRFACAMAGISSEQDSIEGGTRAEALKNLLLLLNEAFFFENCSPLTWQQKQTSPPPESVTVSGHLCRLFKPLPPPGKKSGALIRNLSNAEVFFEREGEKEGDMGGFAVKRVLCHFPSFLFSL